MQFLEQTHSSAHHFLALQGLRIVPFGVLILAITPGKVWPGWPLQQSNLDVTLVLLLLAVFLWLLMDRYYQRRVSRQTPAARPLREALLPVWVLAALVGMVALETALYRRWNQLQISPIELALAAIYLALGLTGKRWYYTMFGALLLATCLLPLITHTTVEDARFGTFGFVFNLVFGAGLVITGVLDHIQLARSFHAPREA